MAARQSVADLEPPIPASDDPIVQWKEFLEWRDQESTRLTREHGDAVENAEVAQAGVNEFRSTIAACLHAVDVVRARAAQNRLGHRLGVSRLRVVDDEKMLQGGIPGVLKKLKPWKAIVFAMHSPLRLNVPVPSRAMARDSA